MYQALVAAFTEGLGTLTNRFLLHNKNVPARKFVLIAYLYFMSFSALAFFFRPEIDSEAFLTINIFVLLLMVGASIVQSLLRNEGLKYLNVEIVEPLFLMNWIFTIFLAFALFPDERNPLNLVLGIVAASAVLSLNIRKKHFRFNRYYLLVLIAAVGASVMSISMNYLLQFYNEVSLVFVRTLLVAIVLLFFIRITWRDAFSENSKFYLIIGLLNVTAFVFLLWSYNVVGVIVTTIIFSLNPLIAEWLAAVFLKEKLHWKNVIVTFIVILCIILSTLN